MPETLTERMARFKLAQAAGDSAAAERIASEAIHQARPTPRPTPQTGYPDWPSVSRGDYERLRADVARLETQNRVLRGELQQQSKLAYDAQRRLTQAQSRIAELEGNEL